jgi:hypothetical protein
LPVCHGCFLITEGRQTPQPKNTSSKMSLGYSMLEEQPRLAGELGEIKSIPHQ